MTLGEVSKIVRMKEKEPEQIFIVSPSGVTKAREMTAEDRANALPWWNREIGSWWKLILFAIALRFLVKAWFG